MSTRTQLQLGLISFHIHASMNFMPYIASVLLLITVITIFMNSLYLDLPAWLSLPSQFPCLCFRLLYFYQKHPLRISIRFACSNFSPFVWECHQLFYLCFPMVIELIIESRYFLFWHVKDVFPLVSDFCHFYWVISCQALKMKCLLALPRLRFLICFFIFIFYMLFLGVIPLYFFS